MGLNVIPGSNIIVSGLDAERIRMDVVSNNLANANSSGPTPTSARFQSLKQS